MLEPIVTGIMVREKCLVAVPIIVLMISEPVVGVLAALTASDAKPIAQSLPVKGNSSRSKLLSVDRLSELVRVIAIDRLDTDGVICPAAPQVLRQRFKRGSFTRRSPASGHFVQF